jgi:hypothetical protein
MSGTLATLRNFEVSEPFQLLLVFLPLSLQIELKLSIKNVLYNVLSICRFLKISSMLCGTVPYFEAEPPDFLITFFWVKTNLRSVKIHNLCGSQIYRFYLVCSGVMFIYVTIYRYFFELNRIGGQRCLHPPDGHDGEHHGHGGDGGHGGGGYNRDNRH